MSGIISALIILTSLLLILVVLVQNSKGGGLSSSFASSNQVMGVRKTADFLEKATWTLVASLVVFCLLSTAMTGSGSEATMESVTRNKAEESGAPAATPTTTPAPAPAPAPTTAP